MNVKSKMTLYTNAKKRGLWKLLAVAHDAKGGGLSAKTGINEPRISAPFSLVNQSCQSLLPIKCNPIIKPVGKIIIKEEMALIWLN